MKILEFTLKLEFINLMIWIIHFALVILREQNVYLNRTICSPNLYMDPILTNFPTSCF